MKVKIIKLDNPTEKTIQPVGFNNLDFFDDKIILENGNYKKLFGRTFKESNYLPWKRKIVKIKKGNITVYRMFFGGSKLGVKEGEMGVSELTYQILFSNQDDQKENTIMIEKGNKLLFYYQHPNHEVRVAFKLGFLSIILTIISLMITIISIIN